MTNKSKPLLVDVNLYANDIEDILNILHEHKYTTNCVDSERIRSLTVLLESFQKKAELEEFRKHIEDSMPDSGNDSEWNDFYCKYWNIRYGGKAIVIDNNAGIYSAMLDLIKEQIDDYL